MTALKSLFIAATCGALAFATVSCGDYVGKEKSHPLYLKGGNCASAGNYKEAAKYFEEFLLVCPKSAKTHYELAKIYGDNLDDPMRAICNYQLYLELSPKDVSDEASVRQFIDTCKRKAFEKMQAELKVTPETEKLSAELAAMKERLNKYVDYAGKLKEQNAELKRRLFGGKKKAPEAAAPHAKSAKMEVYKTKAGDSFESVSNAVYGKSSYAKLIKDANKGVSASASGKLKTGTKLNIPPLPPPGGAKESTEPSGAAPASSAVDAVSKVQPE